MKKNRIFRYNQTRQKEMLSDEFKTMVANMTVEELRGAVIHLSLSVVSAWHYMVMNDDEKENFDCKRAMDGIWDNVKDAYHVHSNKKFLYGYNVDGLWQVLKSEEKMVPHVLVRDGKVLDRKEMTAWEALKTNDEFMREREQYRWVEDKPVPADTLPTFNNQEI